MGRCLIIQQSPDLRCNASVSDGVSPSNVACVRKFEVGLQQAPHEQMRAVRSDDKIRLDRARAFADQVLEFYLNPFTELADICCMFPLIIDRTAIACWFEWLSRTISVR